MGNFASINNELSLLGYYVALFNANICRVFRKFINILIFSMYQFALSAVTDGPHNRWRTKKD